MNIPFASFGNPTPSVMFRSWIKCTALALLCSASAIQRSAYGQVGVAALTEEQYRRAMNGELIDPMEARSQVYKSCADGAVDRWMLFWTVNIPDDDQYAGFDFKTNREIQGLPLAERYGDFIPTSVDYVNHRKYFKVKRPRFLREEYGLFRRDSIIVTYNDTAQLNFEATVIDVHRAPVLFLHGLASGDGAFSAMNDALVSTQYQIPELMFRADYGTHGPIIETAHVVNQSINQLLNDAHDEGFFVGKVDIVAHSLGGLLARAYIQSEEGLDYQDNVHALITCNTPHGGSEVANYVQDVWPYIGLCDFPLYDQLFFCGQVVTDLRTDSEFLDGVLNAPQLYIAPTVPSRAVATWTDAPCDLQLFGVEIDLGTAVPCGSLFNGSPSDGVVRTVSQRGGLWGSKTFTTSGQQHMGSAANVAVIEDVRTALCSDPRGFKFNQLGFLPVNIEMPLGPEVRSGVHGADGAARGTGSLSISQPISGAVFHPGDTLTFVVDCSEEVSYLTAAIGNEEVTPLTWDTAVGSSPVIFQVVIPTSWLGSFQASLVAFDGAFAYVADALTDFSVTTDATPAQLIIEPSVIFCTEGALSFYHVSATYSDGNVVNVTQSGSTMAGIANGAAAVIQEPGVIQGLSPDSTTMTVFYEGLVATADVYVYATDTSNIDDAQFAANARFFCGNEAEVQFYDWSGGDPIVCGGPSPVACR